MCVNKFVCMCMQFTLGGFEQLQSLKVSKRVELGLPCLPEDSIRVMKSMRASSPPTSACDIIDQQQRRTRREHKVSCSHTYMYLLLLLTSGVPPSSLHHYAIPYHYVT